MLVAATEGIRMRTGPSVVTGESSRYTPLLPTGTDLYILSGPVGGSGYWWYEVSPITFRVAGLAEWPDTIVGPTSTGWVAAASRDGVPWLSTGSPTCPGTPAEPADLAVLSFGARIACFGGRLLTISARIIPCNCDVDPPAEFSPSWFAPVRAEQELVLVNPTTRPPLVDWPQALEMQFLRLDPAGDFPDPLPIDRVVAVTGMFDHPAASDCRIRDWTDGRLVISDTCRTLFAVTAIR